LSTERARLRNADVLIVRAFSLPHLPSPLIVFVGIDEATSALDATILILVFEALKQTTIAITDNISHISPGDFVYFLKYGQVVEQGCRASLEMGLG
jgi:ABC-type bacteriocin/lantibiotic exporter with double-glycine peptidase domain